VNYKAEQRTIAGGLVELGTIMHEGREYAALGATVDEYHIAGYFAGQDRHRGDRGEFRTWDGAVLGHYVVLSAWQTRHSWLSDRQISARVTLRDGRQYVVRGGGNGLLGRGKRSAQQLRPIRRGSRRFD
jgi:hypothetical protein